MGLFSMWGSRDDPNDYAQSQEFFKIISSHIKLRENQTLSELRNTLEQRKTLYQNYYQGAQTARYLEDMYNSFYGNSPEERKKSIGGQVQNDIKDSFNQGLQKGLLKYLKPIENNDENFNFIKKELQKDIIDTSYSSHNSQTLYSKLKAITLALNNISFNLSQGTQEETLLKMGVQKKIKEVEKIKNVLAKYIAKTDNRFNKNQIINDINSFINAENGKTLSFKIKKGNSRTFSIIIDRLNRLLGDLRIASNTTVAGIAGEYSAAILADWALSAAKEEVQKSFQESLKSVKSSIIGNQKNIVTGIVLQDVKIDEKTTFSAGETLSGEMLRKALQQEGVNIHLQRHTSKIDVQLPFDIDNEGNPIEGKLNLSVKNYKQSIINSRGIGLVSGTPLSVIFQYMRNDLRAQVLLALASNDNATFNLGKKIVEGDIVDSGFRGYRESTFLNGGFGKADYLVVFSNSVNFPVRVIYIPEILNTYHQAQGKVNFIKIQGVESIKIPEKDKKIQKKYNLDYRSSDNIEQTFNNYFKQKVSAHFYLNQWLSLRKGLTS